MMTNKMIIRIKPTIPPGIMCTSLRQIVSTPCLTWLDQTLQSG